MAFEKSGCLQLTQEELEALQTFLKFSNGDMTKISSEIMIKTAGMDFKEIKAILESGEYRIVED